MPLPTRDKLHETKNFFDALVWGQTRILERPVFIRAFKI